MLSFKSTFSLSSFTFIKTLFSSSSLSVIRVVVCAYLRLLILFLEILIPAWFNGIQYNMVGGESKKINILTFWLESLKVIRTISTISPSQNLCNHYVSHVLLEKSILVHICYFYRFKNISSSVKLQDYYQ